MSNSDKENQSIPTDDALQWAEYFNHYIGHKYGVPEDVMVGYFANAIERAHDKRKEKILEQFDEVIGVPREDGNYDEYMRGLYNGMVMMRAILTNTEPEYRDKQENESKGTNHE